MWRNLTDLKMNLMSRFEKFVMPEPNTGCHLWMGALRGKGYGSFSIGNKDHIASRVAYELYTGHIPENMVVCHSCNQPSCVNPNHLYIGSYSDNTQQAVRDGRHFVAAGQKNGQVKLTDDQVLAIRKDSRYQREIAKDYGISQLHVSRIKRKLVWKDL